jgi:hypothetical protein
MAAAFYYLILVGAVTRETYLLNRVFLTYIHMGVDRAIDAEI